MSRRLGRPIVFIGSSTPALKIAKTIGIALNDVAEAKVWDSAFDEDSWLLGGILDKAQQVDFAVFIIHPDDITEIGDNKFHSVRDNVLFEAGIFMGALGVDRTVLLWPEQGKSLPLRLPSDLAGLLRVPYSPATKGRALRVAHAVGKLQAKISLMGPALRSGYNEIAALKQMLVEQDVEYVDDTSDPLSVLLQKAAARRNRPWFTSTRVEVLTSALEKDNDRSVVDIVYWWLVIYGVVTFNNIEQWTGNSWKYTSSVEFAQFTARGTVLLNEFRASASQQRNRR